MSRQGEIDSSILLVKSSKNSLIEANYENKNLYISVQILKVNFYLFTSQLGPGAAWEKFNAFIVKQSFFSSDLFMFCGYIGVRGLDWRCHLSWCGGLCKIWWRLVWHFTNLNSIPSI